MARVKRSVHAKKKRRQILERAQGYYGNKSRSYRAANEQLMHSMQDRALIEVTYDSSSERDAISNLLGNRDGFGVPVHLVQS